MDLGSDNLTFILGTVILVIAVIRTTAKLVNLALRKDATAISASRSRRARGNFLEI